MNGTTPFPNALGMSLQPIPAGEFDMGSEGGDVDERPVHRVVITQAFWMAATEVTNAQYEQFDPTHRAFRGRRGLSGGDDEAAVFVSWHDAMAFCQWLSRREGRVYRLPTEAEWEYACRAGTTTPYHTGETLPEAFHRHQEADWNPHPVSLRVGQMPPNAWGLHEMHGNVEEWCLDTYGPYAAGRQVDPVGCGQGDMKVARGGSHNTELVFLRSANRLGTLPEDRHWNIGFRVVCGAMPATRPAPPPPLPEWARKVSDEPLRCPHPTDPSRPFFATPRPYVHIPDHSEGPLYDLHNHGPTVTWCDNGDLLAAWFSTRAERGRELTVAASRLRAGAEEWDAAVEFFKAPDRNMSGTSLFNDGQGTLFHVNGLDAGARWQNLALVLRTSRDHGATWSKPRFIQPEHQLANQPMSAMLRTGDGTLLQPCDAAWDGQGGTVLHRSEDGGATWQSPDPETPIPAWTEGGTGLRIAGTHAAVVELRDGRLLAFGRGDTIGGRMPCSLSSDAGRTWTYSASPFPPISWGQRLVLLRLREGPLLFCSFTDPCHVSDPAGLWIRDQTGGTFQGFGLFAAASEDDGQTWPHQRLLTEDKPGITLRWRGTPRRLFRDDGAATPGMACDLDACHAEPKGYLCGTQGPDGIIHVLSSVLHYRFNLAWLKAAPPARIPASKENA